MPPFLSGPLLLLSLAQAVALPRAVPYLPQTEALCGGAAAAMVMRYWGADARAEDFAPLIDPSQDGIVTTALVADLQKRGWQAFPLRGSANDAQLRTHLSRGRPLIALIEDRPSRYHYVVITAIDDARVHFHDPAIAPSQTMASAEFNGRWSVANFWMLLLLPGGSPPDIAAAPDEPALAANVAALLRAGKTGEALQIATDATMATPASAVAWDALATTLFVMDRDVAALAAWNRAGKPDIDTVQITGLSRTRFRPAEQLVGLESGERLMPSKLLRARRRLALLPSAAASRVSYTPRADGRVQIDAAIVERSQTPAIAELMMTAAKAPFSRDVEVSITNIVGGGERVIGLWRFREGFERVEAAVEAPAPLPLGAVWKISGIDTRETYRVRGTDTESRWRRGGLQIADWVSGSLGWTAAAAFERWPEDADNDTREKLYLAGRATLAAGSRFDAHVTAEGWMRGAGATRLSALAQFAAPALGGRATILSGTEGVHGRTPLFLLAGAGDGHIRRPLLRAHPLIDNDAINVDRGQVFARRLLHATIEWTRPLARLGPASIDGALFVDGARGWQLLDGRGSDHQADAGAGLRVRLLGTGPTFRVDVARGLRDRRWAISAGTVVTFEKWIY